MLIHRKVGWEKEHKLFELWPGILTITKNGEEMKAVLHAGFTVQDKVTIRAEIIEWISEIDVFRVESAESRAEERIREHAPGTDMDRAALSLKRAVARIEAV